MVMVYTGEHKADGRFIAFAGIIGILIGVIAVLAPAMTLRIILFILGFGLLFVALVCFAIAAFIAKYHGIWAVPAAIGLIALVLSLVSLFEPVFVSSVIVILVAVLAIIVGLTAVVFGSQRGLPGAVRAGTLLSGGLLIAAGIIMVIYPGITAVLMVEILGVMFVILGILGIVTGIRQVREDPGVITVTPLEKT